MSDILKLFLPRIFAMIQSGGRSSAIKPLLCLAVFSLGGMWVAPEYILIYNIALKGIFACSFACVVFVALISYIILIFKNPRLLQSEHYQLAMRKMDLAAQRQGTPPSFIDVNDEAQTETLKKVEEVMLPQVMNDPNSVKGIAAREEA